MSITTTPIPVTYTQILTLHRAGHSWGHLGRLAGIPSTGGDHAIVPHVLATLGHALPQVFPATLPDD